MAADSRGDISPGRGGRSSSPSHSSNGAGESGANAGAELGVAASKTTHGANNAICRAINYDNGDAYEGEIKDDKRHGKGVYKYANGNVYDGEWKNDMEHGHGTYAWASGAVYDGEWKDSKRNGTGMQTFADGAVYEGQWVEGKRHGRGTKTWPDGEVYDGEWKGGLQYGHGTMTWADGDVDEGEWVEGEQIWAKARTVTRASLGASEAKQMEKEKRAEEQPTKDQRLYDERTLRSQRSQQRRLQRNTSNKTCEHCGLGDGSYKLRVCSGCNLALYCSAACQKAARRSHQRICDIISDLPPREGEKLVLTYDNEKMVDLDAGLRYGTKYMGNLKHLQVDLREMAENDTIKISAKQISSLLRGGLDSLFMVSDGRHPQVHCIFEHAAVWKEVYGLKQLWLYYMMFDDAQHICDIISQQKNTLKVLCLPALRIDWHKAKCRRTIAQGVSACKHLVKLDLQGCVLMDSDLKVMLQDLPHLRALNLLRDVKHSHEFTDNTCGLIARKCPGLQELDLRTHDHLSVRGIRKIFKGCAHLRSFYTTTPKLSCKDVRGLLDTAPQLMYLSLEGGVSFSAGELDDIIEATSGRTFFALGFEDDCFYEPKEEGVSAKTRENYDRTKAALDQIWGRWDDPEIANEWEGVQDR